MRPWQHIFGRVPKHAATVQGKAIAAVLSLSMATGCSTGLGDEQASRPPAAALPSAPPTTPNCPGPALEHRDIEHPKHGPTRIFLLKQRETEGFPRGCIVAVSSNGKSLMAIEVETDKTDLQFANPATDATGNTFVVYNPGRYDGILVLVPQGDGFADIGWTDPTSHYLGGKLAFYNAELTGPGADGQYTITRFVNSCIPSCAEGSSTQTVLRWNGKQYLPTL